MKRRIAGGVVALMLLADVGVARGSTGIDSPENGVTQLGRGSAWVARADDPLAVFYNPAALPTQASGIHAGVQLVMLDRCYARRDANGNPVSPGNDIPGPGQPGGPAADVCAIIPPFPDPHIAGVIRISRDLAVGLAVLGPHGVGRVDWPETIEYKNSFGVTAEQPAPNRYMRVSGNSVVLFPTLSVGYALADDFSVGVGFIWGVAHLSYSNFVEALSPSNADEFDGHEDVKVELRATDAFIPGFVLGGLWQASDRLDLGAWFKWMDRIGSDADVKTTSLYWQASGSKDPQPCKGQPDSKCNITDPSDKEGLIRFAIPAEAKLGLRYHHPRPGSARPKWARGENPVRDPMSEDLFDVEVDLTWAHNTAVKDLEVRFRGSSDVPCPDAKPCTIPVRGTPGTFPQNADVPHRWRDVLGVHVGGDYVAIPNVVALRAGGFVEAKGQDDEYLTLDFHVGTKVGVAGGGTVRLGPVDVAVAYQHTFFSPIDNGGKGAVKAISGDASTGFRSRQHINGGKLTSSLNEVGLSGTLRF